MSTKTNTLRVRRIDLLEQLEQRLAFMSKEKVKYDKAMAVYQTACDKYFKDIEKWEDRIPKLLEGLLRDEKVSHSHRVDRFNHYERWDASISVSLTRDEVIALLGPEPEKPEMPDTPDFLRERHGYKYEHPSMYQAVYQAVQLLHMSDDEYVGAATYQSALGVL